MSNPKQLDENELPNAAIFDGRTLAMDHQCIIHEPQNYCHHLKRSLIDIPILHKISICTYPHNYTKQDFVTATGDYDHEKKTHVTPKDCQCAICKEIACDKLKELKTKNKKMRTTTINDQGEKIANLSFDDLFNQLYEYRADIDNKSNEWQQNMTVVHDANIALKEEMNNLNKKNKFSNFLMILMGIIVTVLFIVFFISYQYNNNDIRMKIEMNQRFMNTETNQRFIDLEQELNRSMYFNRLQHLYSLKQQKKLRYNLYSLDHDIKSIHVMHEKRLDALKTQRNKQDENINNHITSITEQMEDINNLIHSCFLIIFMMVEFIVIIKVIKAIDNATNVYTKIDRDKTAKTIQSKLTSGMKDSSCSKNCQYKAVNIMDEEEEEKDTEYAEYAAMDTKEFENKVTDGDNLDILTTPFKLDTAAIEQPIRTVIDDELDTDDTKDEEEKDCGPPTLNQNRSEHKYTAFEQKREDNEPATASEVTLNDFEFKFYLVGTDHIEIDDILNQNGYTKPNDENKVLAEEPVNEQMLCEVTETAINAVKMFKTNTKMVIRSQAHNLQKLHYNNNDNNDQPTSNNHDKNNNENENKGDDSTADDKTDESNNNQNNSNNGSGHAEDANSNDDATDNNNQNNSNNDKNNDRNNDDNSNNDNNDDNKNEDDEDKDDEDKDNEDDDEEEDEDQEEDDEGDEDDEQKDANNNQSTHIVPETHDKPIHLQTAAVNYSKSVPNPATTKLNATAAPFTPSFVRPDPPFKRKICEKVKILATIKETKNDSNMEQISANQSTLPAKRSINHQATSPMQYIKSQNTEKNGESSPKVSTTTTTKTSPTQILTQSEIANTRSVPNPSTMMSLYPTEITTRFNMQQSMLPYLPITNAVSVYQQLNAFNTFPTKPVNHQISPSMPITARPMVQKKDEASKTCNATTKKKQSKNAKRKRRNKAANTNETTYEPHDLLRAQGHIDISRTMIEETIPGAIKEHYSNLNHFIDRYTALNYGGTEFNTTNGKIKILNCDFHDRHTNEILYCKCDAVTNRRYQWKIDRLMTKDEIVTEYKNIAAFDLPKSPRTDHRLSQRPDHENKIKETLTNSTKMRQKIEQQKWQSESNERIPVFSKKNGKRSMTLNLERTEFIKQFQKFVDDATNFNLIPILMFQGTNFGIEYVWIIAIDDGNINIGISFKYNEISKDVEITGIHTDKNWLKEQHELVSSDKNEIIRNCLDNFSSNITHLNICGNPDDVYYKYKYDKIKTFVKESVNMDPFNVESFRRKGREIIAK